MTGKILARLSAWITLLALAGCSAAPALAPTATALPPAAEPAGIFAAGTQEIYALITYGNMAEGMVFRREWYRDNSLWLEREEAWDFARYGASGTRTDISIYDFDNGLPEGRYQLRLYIDGREVGGYIYVYEDGVASYDESGRIFTIRRQPAAWDAPISSPDGNYVLAVEPPNRIALQQPDGTSKTLVEATWIEDVQWFPDSDHFAYTDVIGEPDAYSWEIKYHVWIFSVAGEQGWQIEDPELAEYDVPMRAPVISPDGRKLVLITGDGYGDACGGGHSATFVILDEAFMTTDFFDIRDFSGLPESGYESIVVSGWPPPGEWVDNSTFKMGLGFTCATQNLNGLYAFNLDTMTTRLIEPLPAP